MKPIIYAGIGSRKTPLEVLNCFTRIGKYLANQDCLLRSGGANGADSAFEKGVDMVGGSKQIFLPWKGFNGNSSNLYFNTKEAYEMASKFHPAWSHLSSAAKKLMARNCFQVLGWDLDEPADLIICYTPGGTGSGGTGQALRIAKCYDIPVFDAGAYSTLSQFRHALYDYLETL